VLCELVEAFPKESTEAMERRMYEEEVKSGYVGDDEYEDEDMDKDVDVDEDEDDEEDDSDKDHDDDGSDGGDGPGGEAQTGEGGGLFDYSLLHQRRLGQHVWSPQQQQAGRNRFRPFPPHAGRRAGQERPRPPPLPTTKEGGSIGVVRSGSRTTAEQRRWARSSRGGSRWMQ